MVVTCAADRGHPSRRWMPGSLRRPRDAPRKRRWSACSAGNRPCKNMCFGKKTIHHIMQRQHVKIVKMDLYSLHSFTWFYLITKKLCILTTFYIHIIWVWNVSEKNFFIIKCDIFCLQNMAFSTDLKTRHLRIDSHSSFQIKT